MGTISSFIDALHLSYHEVVYEIPYRTLMLMQKDKSRPCFGKKVVHISGKEMMQRRMDKIKG